MQLLKLSKVIILLLYLAPSSVNAQDLKKTADVISYGTVISQVTLDTIHSYRSDNRKLEFKREVLDIGITVGLSELIKRIVKERRPDDSDNLSFWSEHTAIAASTQGWNFKIGIPITGVTGAGRVAAKRHFYWDVLAGAGVGSLVNVIVKDKVK